MTVDYLSTLNSGGSGLNITQLVDTLVAAEIEPKKQRVTDKQAAIDLSISELAKVRSALETVKTTLSMEGAGQAFSVASSSAAVSIAISDYATLENRISKVVVNTLARGQVLEFTGFTSATQDLGAGDLSIDFGTWSGGSFTADTDRTAQVVTLATGATGLDDLATQLSTISGVSARVVDKGDGTYSLSVQTDEGASNAIRITAAGGLSDFDTTDASNEVISAIDAELVVDGVTVHRAGNTITDLVAGATLTLNDTTSSAATIAVAEDPDLAEAELKAFVSALNDARAQLNASTKRGMNGAASGALVADTAISAMNREFAALTTTPLTGFGSDAIYLSSLGVRTERDGSLTLDSTAFQAAFAADPSRYRAMFQSLDSSSSEGITIAKTTSANPPAGAYEFVYSDAGTATLNGVALSSSVVNGTQTFRSLTGDFAGVTLSVTESYPSTSTVYFGKSMISRVQDYLTTALGKGGAFETRATQYGKDATTQTDELSDLTDSETHLRSIYTQKFGAMEQLVTQFHKTGEYLTSLMDAWNKKD